VPISALKHTGFDEMQELMIKELSKQRSLIQVRIPQSDYSIVSEILRSGKILKKEYEDNDVIMKIDLPSTFVGRLKKYIET
jgi:GTP-binding protein HflX